MIIPTVLDVQILSPSGLGRPQNHISAIPGSIHDENKTIPKMVESLAGSTVVETTKHKNKLIPTPVINRQIQEIIAMETTISGPEFHMTGTETKALSVLN